MSFAGRSAAPSPNGGNSTQAPDGSSRVHHEHSVQFYESDAFLCEAVSRFVHQGLMDGLPIIVLATESHWKAIGQRLQTAGYDIDRACRRGQITAVGADDVLGRIMVGSMPDENLFRLHVGGMMESSLRQTGRSKVHAYGELVDVLWRDGNTNAALRLEELWNDLALTHDFTLLCGYAMGHFYMESHAESLRRVCAGHSHVLPTETYTPMADEDTRAREILMLQQKARSLESEIEHRKRLEAALRESIADRREAEEAARASERHLKDFLENAVEGLHWVGPDGIILWANRAELELLGYSADEYVGHHIGEFHVDQGTINDILSRLARGEVLHEYEATMRSKDGSPRHVLINSNVVWEGDEFIHTRCFTRDITARRRMEEALRLAKEEVERASHVKTDLRALVQETAELIAPLADARGLAVVVAVPEVAAHCASDEGRLRQILLNLLSNALKFTSEGRIEIVLSQASAGWRIDVRDTGIGIVAEDLARIFEPFVQLNGGHTRDSGGTGLGLPVSRQLARLLGGELRVYSVPGEGSVFTLEIPAAAPSPAARPVAQAHAKL